MITNDLPQSQDNEKLQPKKKKKFKKNAWTVMGYRLPNWIAPRKRNKDENGKAITRAKEDPTLPCNVGVHPKEYTKED